MTLVMDGRVLGEQAEGAPPTAAQRRFAALPVDSIFDLRFVSDSAGLAMYGLCPGATAAVATTTAEARRLGLRPPPPALCLRTTAGRTLPRLAFPVGSEFRFTAGQRDILDECDREAPPGVRWGSSAPAVAAVDSVGRLRALSPGTAEVVARVGGAEARFAVTVVPPVARIEIRPGDTTMAVGDTVRFRAVALGADGRPVPGAVLAMRATETRASYLAADSAGRRVAGLGEVYSLGPSAPRPVPNELPVRAGRVASGYVVAAVVGRADSVRVRAVAP
jgi:hypothetical protein